MKQIMGNENRNNNLKATSVYSLTLSILFYFIRTLILGIMTAVKVLISAITT